MTAFNATELNVTWIMTAGYRFQGPGTNDLKAKAVNVQPTDCPTQGPGQYPDKANVDCSRNPGSGWILVTIDSRWYSCTSGGTSTIYLWVHGDGTRNAAVRLGQPAGGVATLP